MKRNHLYVLIHSPLVGGLTWAGVADQMQQRDLEVIIPFLADSPDSEKPFWKQHAESVSRAMAKIPHGNLITLVAHSGAGPLLPVIRQTIPNPIHAYVFVDAGIPRDGETRLDLMRSEDPDAARQFEETLERGERFPTWSKEDLREIIPNESLREQLVTELRPRALSFFKEPIPVFHGWPDAPCVYIRFSASYQKTATWARETGWQTYTLNGDHFHMLVDAPAVTEIIIKAVDQFV